MADGFIWYELATNDINKAVNFYKKVVGWDVKDAGMPGFSYMIFGKDGKDVGGMMTWAGALKANDPDSNARTAAKAKRRIIIDLRECKSA